MRTEYDQDLECVKPPFYMLPWIGQNYQSTKLLFVGESDYDDGTEFNLNWKRDWIWKERILKTGNVRVLDGIDKTVLNNISNEARVNLWNSVAYTNLVQRVMNYNIQPKEKPNYEDFSKGWETLLQLILIIKPHLIIKWGFAGDGIFRKNIHNKIYSGWELDLINGDSRYLNLIHESGYKTRIVFVKHPSYPSTERKRKICAILNEMEFPFKF